MKIWYLNAPYKGKTAFQCVVTEVDADIGSWWQWQLTECEWFVPGTVEQEG